MRRGGKGADKPNRKAETNQIAQTTNNGDEKNEDALRRTAATWTATEEGSYSVARATASACEDSIEPKKNKQTPREDERVAPSNGKLEEGRESERKRMSEGRRN
jgi:hypothetical protein